MTNGCVMRAQTMLGKESDMARTFEFQDGSPHDKSARLDTRTGKLGGWSRDDFTYTINVHQRAFGARYTSEILFRMFGMSDPTRVPSYAYGTIIAVLASEMASGLPHHIARSPLYAGNNRR
jgi:hypothetical protein